MGGPRLTEDEAFDRAERSRMKAQRQLLEARIAKIKKILKEHPELVNDIHEHAVKLSERGAAGYAAPRAAQSNTPALLGPDSAANTPSRGPSAALARPIDRRTKDLQQLPVCDLKMLLFMLDKKSFGTCAIKALQKNGQREVSKTSMCEVIEHLTGMPPYFVLAGFFGTLSELIEHALDLAKNFPGRASRLHMPPAWDADLSDDGDGVYVIATRSAEEVWLEHRDSGMTFKVPNGTNGVEWTDPAALYVEYNWSDDRACLKTKRCAKEVKLASYVVQRTLALQDGQASEPTASNDQHRSPRPLVASPAPSSGGVPRGLCRPLAAPKRRLTRKTSNECAADSPEQAAKRACTEEIAPRLARGLVSVSTGSGGSAEDTFTTPPKRTSSVVSDIAVGLGKVAALAEPDDASCCEDPEEAGLAATLASQRGDATGKDH